MFLHDNVLKCPCCGYAQSSARPQGGGTTSGSNVLATGTKLRRSSPAVTRKMRTTAGGLAGVTHAGVSNSLGAWDSLKASAIKPAIKKSSLSRKTAGGASNCVLTRKVRFSNKVSTFPNKSDEKMKAVADKKKKKKRVVKSSATKTRHEGGAASYSNIHKYGKIVGLETVACVKKARTKATAAAVSQAAAKTKKISLIKKPVLKKRVTAAGTTKSF